MATLIYSFALSLVVSSSLAQSGTDGVGPGGRYYPVHDFRDDFLVYDEEAKAYVPYLVEQHAGQTALSAYVDLESNRHYNLLISTRQDGYLFINAALKRRLPAGQWQVFSIDSLYQLYRRAERPDSPAPGGPVPRQSAARAEIFLTFYGAPGLDDKQLLIGYPKSATRKPVVLRDDNLSLRPRTRSVYDNFLGVGLLFLLATHAFLYSYYRRAFERFYNLRDLLSLRAQEESFLISRPLSSTNILFTGNLGLVIAYLILFVQSRNAAGFAVPISLPGEQRFGWLVGEFLLLGGVAFLMLMGKYVMLEVLGSLYKLQEIINVHFFKALQSSMLFFTFLTLVLAVITYNTSAAPWLPGALLLPLTAFYAGRLVLLYLVIRSVEPIKNLYLFSYLCIVELIPLIIGLRFAL